MQNIWDAAIEPSEELLSAAYTIESVRPRKWLNGFEAEIGKLTPPVAAFLRIHGWEYNLTQLNVRFSGNRGIQSECKAGLRLRLVFLKIVSKVREFVEPRVALGKVEIPWPASQFMTSLLESARFTINTNGDKIVITGRRRSEAQIYHDNVRYWEEEAERRYIEECAERDPWSGY
jgi:hypothetical protein